MRSLTFDEAKDILRHGLLIDLRPIEEYLSLHIRGSIPLLYEPGPGLGTRARDLLPLDSHLVLIDDGSSPMEDAASRLRGKGFEVSGFLQDGLRRWPGGRDIAGTPRTTLAELDPSQVALHIGDPGVRLPEKFVSIPAEQLWDRFIELDGNLPIGILAGFGVRAATAVGILEKLGFRKIAFVYTRPVGDQPVTAGPESFRVGGPG